MTEISATAVKELREKTGAGMMLCKKALAEAGGDLDAAITYLRKQGEITAGKRSDRAAKEGKVGIHVHGNTAVMLELNSETDFVAKNPDFIALLNSLLEAAVSLRPADLAGFKAMKAPSLGNRTVQEAVTEKTGLIGEKIDIRRLSVQETGPDSRIFSYVHLGGKIGVLLKLSASQAAALDHPRVQELGKDLCMQVAAAAPIALSRGEIPKDKIESESVIYRELALKEGKPEKILDKIVAGRLDKFYKETVLLEQPFVKDPEQSVSQVVSGAAKEAGSDLKVVSFLRYQLGVES